MFYELIKRRYYAQKHVDAPLYNERVSFLQVYVDKGRVHTTIKDTACYLLRIIEFLDLNKKRKVKLGEVFDAAKKWARYQYNHPQKKINHSKTSEKKFIWIAIEWLKKMDCLASLDDSGCSIITRIFERGAALKRHATAPLLTERLRYLQYWAENGAVDNSLRRIAQYLLLLMDYLNFYEIRTVSITEIEKAAELWATTGTTKRQAGYLSKSAKRRFIADAKGWFKMMGCLAEPATQLLAFEKLLNSYINYTRNEEGLAESTIESKAWMLKGFLSDAAESIDDFNEITPVILDNILIKKHDIDGYSRRTIQTYASVLRPFLRYAESQGWCSKGLADSIKAPRVYTYESLPYAPSWNDVQQLLAFTNTDKPTDIRDYAVILLLATYGLRCGEIKNLRLDDINWSDALLSVRRSKTSKAQTYPLSKTVGEAIIEYIKEVRPNNSKVRNVFLCRKAPYRALSSGTVYQIVNRKFRALEINVKHRGPHALRHACATHLINDGISLKEIGDHLGHSNLETTRIYAKVDLVSLRKVAEFDLRSVL